jgi:mevalonate kinase
MPTPSPAEPLAADRPVLATAVAPAKIILLGEHAVVYGQPALAVPVDGVEAQATVFPAEGPLTVRAHFPPAEARPPRSVEVGAAPEEDALATAVREALRHVGGADRPAWLIEVTSSIPTGRGMGSSAALAVAIVRAVGRAAGVELDDDTVALLAFEAERRTHGAPSGIDNTVIAHRRPIHFRQGHAEPAVVGAPVDLVIADSGAASATREMVAAVGARRAGRPAVYDTWFERIGRLVEEAAAALAGGDLPRLGRLMNTNHLILQALEVSTPALDALVATARHGGALGAKLSGAGGGGVVVALATAETAQQLADALGHAGAAGVFHTQIGASGRP